MKKAYVLQFKCNRWCNYSNYNATVKTSYESLDEAAKKMQELIDSKSFENCQKRIAEHLGGRKYKEVVAE